MMFWVGLFVGTLFGMTMTCVLVSAKQADLDAERWFYEQEMKRNEQSNEGQERGTGTGEDLTKFRL